MQKNTVKTMIVINESDYLELSKDLSQVDKLVRVSFPNGELNPIFLKLNEKEVVDNNLIIDFVKQVLHLSILDNIRIDYILKELDK